MCQLSKALECLPAELCQPNKQWDHGIAGYYRSSNWFKSRYTSLKIIFRSCNDWLRRSVIYLVLRFSFIKLVRSRNNFALSSSIPLLRSIVVRFLSAFDRTSPILSETHSSLFNHFSWQLHHTSTLKTFHIVYKATWCHSIRSLLVSSILL